jgi:DNA-binding PadR family transcriptional regulator
MRKLSELEGAALGIIARAQPLTPYQLRKYFAISPNPHWSASAGSIYPLVERLEAARLVRAEEHATGERVGWKYSITVTGRKRLRTWILGGDTVKVIGLPDLLRVRVAMMPVLPPAEQRQFIALMEQKLRETLAITRADVARKQQEGDPLNLLISRGALLQTEARLHWIHEVQATLFGVQVQPAP